MRRKIPNENTPREVAAAINNAVAMQRQTKVGKTVGEERRRKLRHFTMELVQILEEDVAEGLLLPDELVMILLGGAMFVHYARVLNTTKGPMMQDMLKEVLEEEENG